MSVTALKKDSSVLLHDADVIGDYWPLLPAGRYLVNFQHHETSLIFNSAKVFVHFKISEGEYAGARLFRAYRAHRLIGRPGKNGRFQLKPGSELYRTVCRLSPSQKRPDRISLRPWRHVIFSVSVRTVNQDARQRQLPESLRYSVVDDILSIEAGSLS